MTQRAQRPRLGWPALGLSLALASTGCPSGSDPSKPPSSTLKPRPSPSTKAASAAPAPSGAPSGVPSSLASGLPGPSTKPSSGTSVSPTPGTLGGASPTPQASTPATGTVSPSPAASGTASPSPSPSASPSAATFPTLAAPNLTPNLGEVLTLAGNGVQGDANGSGAEVNFRIPRGLAFAPNGRLYVAEGGATRLRQVEVSGNTTTFVASGFSGPAGVAADTAGNLYVADAPANVIRKVTPAGVVTLFAGGENQQGTSLGSATATRFNQPLDLAVDVNGNVYVADTGNNRVVKLTPGTGGPSAPTAGTSSLYAGGGGGNLNFLGLGRVAIDGSGVLWVGDSFAVYRVTAANVGEPLTLTGATPTQPMPIAHPRADGLRYIYSPQQHVIYKVAAPVVAGGAYTLERLAGQVNVGAFADGDATNARMDTPNKVVLGDDGTLYFVDTTNERVRRIR